MGLWRRRLNIIGWVFSREYTQLEHCSIKIFHSKKTTEKKVRPLGRDKKTQGTYTARVRIMAICAHSTVWECIGFPVARTFSSTTFHFFHNSSANPTTSHFMPPCRHSNNSLAFPHISSESSPSPNLQRHSKITSLQWPMSHVYKTRTDMLQAASGFNSTPLNTLSAKGKEVGRCSSGIHVTEVSQNHVE